MSSTPRITYHVTNWRGKITPPISAFCKAHSLQKSYNHPCPVTHETSRAGRAFHVLSPTLMKKTIYTLAALLLAAVALTSCSKDDTPQETRTPSSSSGAATLQVTMQGDTTASRDVNVKFDIPSDDSPAL